MAAEIGAVAGIVKRWPPVNDPWGRILAAVNSELIARYGQELGARLDVEFYNVFEVPHLETTRNPWSLKALDQR